MIQLIKIFQYITSKLSGFKYFTFQFNINYYWRYNADVNIPINLYLIQTSAFNIFFNCDQIVLRWNVFVEVCIIISCEGKHFFLINVLQIKTEFTFLIQIMRCFTHFLVFSFFCYCWQKAIKILKYFFNRKGFMHNIKRFLPHSVLVVLKEAKCHYYFIKLLNLLNWILVCSSAVALRSVTAYLSRIHWSSYF